MARNRNGGERPGAEIATPQRTRRLMAKYGIVLKKSLGQNFLVDLNILRKIVDCAELDESKGALEIGPGIGALTEQLAKRAGKVVAVEIDRRLLPALQDALAPYENVDIVAGDVLKLDLAALIRERFAGMSAVSVVANLPYYVTTPIVMKLLDERLPLEYIVVMVQKEVAARMAAPPGSKDYGSLSVAVQYYCEPELAAIVPQTVFIPKPNVDSAVVKMKVRTQPPVAVRDENFFFDVVHAAFAQRRKTIANNLLHRFFGKEARGRLEAALQAAGIEPARRAETLSLAEFAALSDALLQQM